MSDPGSLTAKQVVSVYEQVLGREPSEAEVEARLSTLHDLDAMLRIALDSDEYAVRLAETSNKGSREPTVVNVYHPDLERYGLQPGTRSPDGDVVVGTGGQLLLSGGANAVLGQYTGELQMAPDWLDEWRRVLVARDEEMAAAGLARAVLIAPDKLAVYEDRYPTKLEPWGPRPVDRLLAIPEVEVHYPLAELRAAAAVDDVYLRTDTHLTFHGSELLFASIAGPLGIEPGDFSALPTNAYAITGDLGLKFDPPIVSIVHDPTTLGPATIVEDNLAEMEAVGGHIGTRRVFRNEIAADRRTAVLFGDSFSFAGPSYQGIAWFMAQAFREVHFVWIPFGWDPDYVRAAGAEAVLIQGAERFVPRVPHPRAAVAELAAATLRNKQPIGVEAVSD